MIDFDTDKKKASHAGDAMILILALLVTGTAGCCFGYTRGQKSVEKDAISMGYAEDREGFAWKSKRAIAIGDK